MPQYSWTDYSGRLSVERLVERMGHILVEDLIGVYLHGSLAMGCFNPRWSDLDLLVVTARRLSVEAKRALVELLLERSAHPEPIELSVLAWGQLHQWRYPCPFDLHYSESWRRRYEVELAFEAWRFWNDVERTDVDLAAHITHVHDRGVVLHGPPIAAVFPVVPRADYLAAILDDYDAIVRRALARTTDNRVYSVLNMVRVYRYLLEGTLSSKDEGGAWAMTTLRDDLQPIVAEALHAYRGALRRSDVIDPDDLRAFASAIDERMKELRARNGTLAGEPEI